MFGIDSDAQDAQDDANHGLLPGTTAAVDPSSAWPIAGDVGTYQGTGAGRYGLGADDLPSQGTGSMIGDAFRDVLNWLNTPFRSPMSPVEIGLMVGVVLIAILFWNLLLYHIRIAAESL